MVQRSQSVLTALGPSKEFDEAFLLGRNDEGTDEGAFCSRSSAMLQTMDSLAGFVELVQRLASPTGYTRFSLPEIRRSLRAA